MQITKRQHYVWRFYLKPWSDDKNTIACNRNQKIFRSDLMNIGQENYFYKIEEISDSEAKWVEAIFIDDNFPEFLKKMDKDLITAYRLPYKAIRLLENHGNVNESEFENILHEGEEKAFGTTEQIGQKYLEKLYNEDASFYNNKDDKSIFNIFISEQYFRTKRMQDALKRMPDRGIDFNKLRGPIRHIMAFNLAYALTYRNDKDYHLNIIKNQTNLNFITGDQPVINRYATKEKQNKTVHELELYYPITPKLAIIITENKYLDSDLILIDENKIKEFNDLIFYNSLEQVYASSEADLERYKILSKI